MMKWEGHGALILVLLLISSEGLAGCAYCFDLLKVTYVEFCIITMQMFSRQRRN